MEQFEKCSLCDGKGKYGFWKAIFNSGYSYGEICPFCNGTGKAETNEYQLEAIRKRREEIESRMIWKYYKIRIIFHSGGDFERKVIDVYEKLKKLPDARFDEYESMDLYLCKNITSIIREYNNDIECYPDCRIEKVSLLEITEEEYNNGRYKKE